MTRSVRARADIVTVLLSRQIGDASVVVMGTGTPLTAVAVLHALRGHAPHASFTTPLAGGLSVLAHQLSLGALERSAFDHAVLRSAQIIDLWETSTINPKVADRWLQFFRPAQMDAYGNMNNSLIIRPDGTRMRLPGSVGISDMAAYYHRIQAYVTRHDRRSFPERVDFVSAPGTIGTEAERQARGLRWGRPFRVVTDLCIFEFADDGRMIVASIHPGVAGEEVVAATGFPVDVTGVPVTLEPTGDELSLLDEVDPGGLRLLELLPARERRTLIMETLLAEQQGLANKPTGR